MNLQGLVELVSRDELVRTLSDVVRIPSVNPYDELPGPGRREREVGDYLLQRLDQLGFETGEREIAPGRPNIWGRLRGSGDGPTVMLAGHMDTVTVEGYSDPFEPKVTEDRVYGRGSCDMKSAFATYLEIARILVETNIPLRGDLLIVGVADEEYQLRGSADMGWHGPFADYGIILEPTDLKICLAHRGDVAFKIRTFGASCHSSSPELGHNAITDMSQVLNALSSYDDELQAREHHPLCGAPRFSMNVIRGGTITHAIPDFCELEVDRRTLPHETPDIVYEEVRQKLDMVPGLKYELTEPHSVSLPLEVDQDCAIAQAARNAFRKVTGHVAGLGSCSGATDAPNFGFPTIVFGAGPFMTAHTLNEYAEINLIETVTKTVLGTVLELIE
ncbi:M20 family metallopeptidase [Leisingera sp. ANG-Vp]|uniref:M20 family metallopeptidase n=1 Tax=Leisingera sp. ANG-Vp TaxID=1577896 RepID=UPI00057EDF56|nr:M20 family metallopeptidase [Leisingera sp. ANG-Vp]KIC14345.1 hypothetical protein RA20_20940 [Leisingera sp. ANG-Vp]